MQIQFTNQQKQALAQLAKDAGAKDEQDVVMQALGFLSLMTQVYAAGKALAVVDPQTNQVIIPDIRKG